MYKDPYADIYQKMEGFELEIIQPGSGNNLKAYGSFKPSTRSTYDIAMRDATVDGIITMDDIELLKPSQIYFKRAIPNELFIIQSVNLSEIQNKTRNINAVKQNCTVTIQRYTWDSEYENQEYVDMYTNIVGFISAITRDEKNFAAGTEDATIKTIQIPKKSVSGTIYNVRTSDRIILKDLGTNFITNVKVESIDEFGVPGVIRIQGTLDTRTGDTK